MVIQLLNISKDQAYRLLKRLIDEKNTLQFGRESGTKYKEKINVHVNIAQISRI